jgi:hypothetical protein
MRHRVVALVTGSIVLSMLACTLPSCGSREAPTESVSPSPSPVTRVEPQEPTPDFQPQAPPAPTDLNVPLRIDNPLDVARTDEPVTSGVPLPRGLTITDPADLRLVDPEGNPVPAQFTPLARWGGGPDDENTAIRWVLVDFQATVAPQSTAYVYLQEGGPGPAPDLPLAITDGPNRLTVDTGASFFTISKIDGSLMAPGLAAPIQVRLDWSDGITTPITAPVTVSIALQGPMRISIHVQGSYGSGTGDTPALDYTSRYWFYAGQPTARLFHTTENNTLCPLVEDGQLDCYDIGSGGSVTFADLSLILPTDLGPDLTCQAGGGLGPVSRNLDDELIVHQNSSGTSGWDTYLRLTDWDGNPLDAHPRLQSTVTFRGYRTKLGGGTVDSGDHAPGWLGVAGENGGWTIGVRDFWQGFPKSLRARPDGVLEVGLFPAEFGSPAGASGDTTDPTFTLRAGEHKTHEIVLSPTPPPSRTLDLPALRPLFAAAPPSWYVESGGLGLTALPDRANWPAHEDYVRHQRDTAPTDTEWMDWHPNLLAAIESTDFYGMFDYGDWPIDYEGYGVAPLNAKYDNDFGAWLQWARTGERRWFDLAESAGRHIADIDILHNRHTPRHWGDGIPFGHSYHDEDGFLNPHRNYGGNHPDTAFGMHGLLLTYYFTGYEKTWESALELADCIEYRLHNDHHLCAAFPDCNGEGYGLDEGLYDAGSRPAANSLSIAVAAYRATADVRYLAVADALVDWARAENQPYIDGPTGDDQMMRPWMLNLYLRALATYLEMRDEFGLSDTYAASSGFLTYADWLRTYPWLDLEPGDDGPRAAYPYEWWFDERQGDPNDEWSAGNNIPSINNWLLLGADAMAHAYRLSGDADYLERAAILFRTGARDPWFEGDDNTYSSTKETINSITFGHTFLNVWNEER